jgi:hypothetical protein
MGSWSFRAPSANLAALVLGAVVLLGAGPTGAIFVTSLPSGADVWLDGTYVDRLGPVMVDGLPVTPAKDGTIAAPAGAHDVTVTLPQGKQTRTVTVYPQTRTDIVLGADTVIRSIVVAPADDYLPASAVHLDGTRLVLHYAGHDVIARLGTTAYTVDKRVVAYDSPLELLTMLTRNDKK